MKIVVNPASRLRSCDKVSPVEGAFWLDFAGQYAGNGRRQVSKRSRCARIVAGALGAAIIAVEATLPAPAASICEKNGYMIGPRFDSYMPVCSDELMLATIQSRFYSKEFTFW